MLIRSLKWIVGTVGVSALYLQANLVCDCYNNHKQWLSMNCRQCRHCRLNLYNIICSGIKLSVLSVLHVHFLYDMIILVAIGCYSNITQWFIIKLSVLSALYTIFIVIQGQKCWIVGFVGTLWKFFIIILLLQKTIWSAIKLWRVLTSLLKAKSN